MILSVWRYSHLTLAISSFLLLTVAALTGIFLAFEPVLEKSRNYRAEGFDTVSLSHAVPLLKETFPSIQEITVDDHDFVIIKYAGEEGDLLSYVNPLTGEILGTPSEKHPFFQWMTTLHRSLFMHETGRWLVGIASFLLILIAISGILLVVQRQNGWRYFFSNVEKTGFAQYYHVVWGRLSLFFILAIAVTGTYLAVYRFVPPPPKASFQIEEENIKEEPELALNDFAVFQQTPLSELKKLQYPFSDFPEDYYNVQLRDKEVCVNQFTGDILAEQLYSTTYQLADFSLRWHTGRSGAIWALFLALASGYILFFIYSGFAITLQRRRSRSKNRFRSKDARIVILVGSENGATFKFADAVGKQLLKHGEKVFITDISRYENFPAAQHLIVMTSTYGQGDPPSNGRKFEKRIKEYAQTQSIQYSVVGFGSRSYAQFCQFAFTVDGLLRETPWAKAIMPVHTVDDKSPQDFSDWLTEWTRLTGFPVMMPRELLSPHQHELKKLSVISRTVPDAEAAFAISFRSGKFRHAVSGDLLAIYPKNDHRERLYSIGIVNGNIQLSVKLHEHGLGSGFLNALKEGDGISARLLKNEHFRFPSKAKKVIMISNGTGIAPFLGMIDENKKKRSVELYCGFRSRTSFSLYEPFLKEQVEKGKLEQLHVSFSREEEKEYVSHRILKNRDRIWETLREGGYIMICGSLSMRDDVMRALEEICAANGSASDTFAATGKILSDCY